MHMENWNDIRKLPLSYIGLSRIDYKCHERSVLLYAQFYFFNNKSVLSSARLLHFLYSSFFMRIYVRLYMNVMFDQYEEYKTS